MLDVKGTKFTPQMIASHVCNRPIYNGHLRQLAGVYMVQLKLKDKLFMHPFVTSELNHLEQCEHHTHIILTLNLSSCLPFGFINQQVTVITLEMNPPKKAGLARQR